jgi:hypothetical protein
MNQRRGKDHLLVNLYDHWIAALFEMLSHLSFSAKRCWSPCMMENEGSSFDIQVMVPKVGFRFNPIKLAVPGASSFTPNAPAQLADRVARRMTVQVKREVRRLHHRLQ